MQWRHLHLTASAQCLIELESGQNGTLLCWCECGFQIFIYVCEHIGVHTANDGNNYHFLGAYKARVR